CTVLLALQAAPERRVALRFAVLRPSLGSFHASLPRLQPSLHLPLRGAAIAYGRESDEARERQSASLPPTSTSDGKYSTPARVSKRIPISLSGSNPSLVASTSVGFARPAATDES
ncbi:MAG: hypothetical protein LJE70_17695, partial [Chromatiaceae bacterium]|nr:hypothetical protein [Chromatiaceae bacterium]